MAHLIAAGGVAAGVSADNGGEYVRFLFIPKLNKYPTC